MQLERQMIDTLIIIYYYYYYYYYISNTEVTE